MRGKEERSKGFARPNLVLSRSQSDGVLGVVEKRHFEDNSL
jgi:hypothetical protein